MSEQTQILVVGDVLPAILHADSALRRRDRSISSASTAAEAMFEIRRRPPRLIAFGFDLGDSSAPDFCRSIRSDAAVRETSLLFIGDRRAENEVDLCQAAGCNDSVLRPVSSGELDIKIERLLSIPIRRKLRTLTRVEVSVERGGNFLLGHSMNVSATGMLLELDHVLPPAARVRLQFYLHGEASPVRVIATTIRADFSGSFPLYGCKFEEIEAGMANRIASYVDRMRSREAL